jgi:hypothetical protein
MDIAFPVLTKYTPELIWGFMGNTGQFVAPIPGTEQTFENPGIKWTLQMVLPNLEEDNATLVQAWLAKLKGRVNRGLMHNIARPNIRGSVTGTPLVNGSLQTGSSLILDAAGNTKTFLAGDFIGFANRLKMVTDLATSDASGNITVNVFPPIYPGESPTDDAAVTIIKPTCRFLLAEDNQTWTTRLRGITDIPINLIEALS